MKILCLWVAAFFCASAFAQSSLHPLKKGTGYYYLQSVSGEFSAEAHNVYFSTGHLDISLSVSTVKIKTDVSGKYVKLNSIGLNFDITSFLMDERLMPSINFSIGAGNDLVLGFGPGLAFLIHDDRFFRIYPEAGAFIIFTGISNGDNLHQEFSFAYDLVIALHLGNFGFLSLQPGYTTSHLIHYYSLAGGLSILL